MVEEVKDNNEKFARHQLIEELFYDLYDNRRRIYWINFIRGLFFGLGTLVGGSLIVGIAIWALSQFTNIFPSTSDYLNKVTESIQKL